MPSVGLIGLGAIVQKHVATIGVLDTFDIVCVCDTDASRRDLLSDAGRIDPDR